MAMLDYDAVELSQLVQNEVDQFVSSFEWIPLEQ
jgi:hypothetical protein